MQPQVLIVGSGPTGLVLAITLLKSGVPVRIIEKEAAYHVSSRGSGMQPRIQEIEHFLGTLSDAKASSTPGPILRYYDPANPSKLVRSANMIEPMSSSPAFPMTAPILVNQYLHEGVLREHLEALSGKVELSTELASIEQDGNNVATTLTKTIDGRQIQEKATFSYVVGADGGRSAVRRMLGLQFLGETHETDKLLNADVDMTGFDEFGMHMFGSHTTLFVSIRTTNVPERYQLLIGGPKYHEIAEECNAAGLEELQAILTRLTGRSKDDLQLKKIHVKTDWKLNVRMVDHFQKGRVFVAGDAAHVHSPMGGQGMTSSIQDAFNLAWKLALVVKGHASPSLLASYEEERLPAIADMLLESSRLHRRAYVGVENEKDERARTAQGIQNTIDVLGRAAAPMTEAKDDKNPEDEPLFRGRKLFQLDLNYRWSPIVLDERFSEGGTAVDAYGKAGHDVRAGDRAPDAPGLVVLSKSPTLEKVGKVAGGKGESVRLFDIFDPTAHTVIIFSSDANFVRDVIGALTKLPAGIVHSLLVVPAEGSLTQDEQWSVNLALVDKDGHGFRGYGLDITANITVVVRPDGMIGAFAKGSAGVERYFARLLAGTSF
ncbi:FAD binding domain-containing protein [Phellopilus nigrolimitatus]|nr:FAD binding domain-containing protein [Phellopilus nigrolimitatus]